LRKIFEIKSSFGEDCLETEVEFEKKNMRQVTLCFMLSMLFEKASRDNMHF
jgi:hypothetical protein